MFDNQNQGGFDNLKFNIMLGTIDEQDNLRFKRMIFRASKGNVITMFEPIFINQQNENVYYFIKNNN